MILNFSDLFARTISVIRKEPLIIAPYMLFFLIVHAVQNLTAPFITETISSKQLIIGAFIIGWISELIFKGITILLTQRIAKDLPILLGDQFKELSKKFYRLVLSTGIVAVPFFIGVTLMVPKDQNASAFSLLTAITMFVLIIFIIFIMEFIPVVVMLESSGWIHSLKRTVSLVLSFLKDILMFSLINLFLLMGTLMTSFMVMGIPVLGESVFQVVIKAFGYSAINIMAVFAYFQLTGTTLPERQPIEE